MKQANDLNKIPIPTEDLEKTAKKQIIAEIDFLRDLVQQAPGFVIVLLDRDHKFYMVNNAFMKLSGHRDLIGKTVAEAMPEIPRQGFIALLDQIWETGEALTGNSVPVLFDRPNQLEPDLRYVDFLHQPIKSENGELLGIYVQGIDITERKNFETRLEIVAQESTHRVKNIIAMINSVVNRSLQASKSKEEALTTISARLQTIAAAQNPSLDQHLDNSDLETLIDSAMVVAIETYDCIDIKGPRAIIPEKARLPLALTLHELTTNAIKYGALSVETGKITIYWTIDETMVHLVWKEIDGPMVQQPQKKGFGSTLIERSLGFDPRNQVNVFYNKGGLECQINLAMQT